MNPKRTMFDNDGVSSLDTIEVQDLEDPPSSNLNFNKIENNITVPWAAEDNSAFGYIMGCLFGLCGIWCVFCVREKSTYLKAWAISAAIITTIFCIIPFILLIIAGHNSG